MQHHFSFSCGLVLFDDGSGEEKTDAATAHESLELSELNETSITPMGLPGNAPNLRLFELKSTLEATS